MATTIQGAKSTDYIKTKINGLDGTDDTLNYATIQDVVGKRAGMDIVQHGKSKMLTGLAIEAGSAGRKIVSTAHGLKAGWIMQPTTGASIGEEISILNVLDADSFVISTKFDMMVGDLFDVYRHITANYNADGDLNVQVTAAGPVQYLEDGVITTSNRDTTDESLNKTLPVNDYLATEAIKANQTLKFMKNGVMVEVADDANPANVAAVPVEIKAVGGTSINITAGDINVQTSSEGVNFDSMRIGDGSGNYIGVTADQEAKVTDAKNGLKLDAIQTTVSTLATETTLNDTKVAVEGLLSYGIAKDSTVVSTNSKLDDIETINTSIRDNVTNVNTDLNANHLDLMDYLENVQEGHLNSIDTKLTTAATEATLAFIYSILSDPSVANAPASDYASATIHDRLARIAENITALSAKFAALGQNNSANSLSIVPANDASFPVTTTVPTTGTQSKGTLAMAASTTVNAPVGAKGFIIKNKASSEGTLHWEIGGTANADSFDLIPTTGTATINCSANISLYASEGSVNYAVQWFH